MMSLKKIIPFIFLFFSVSTFFAQDDLLNLVDDPKASKPQKVYATFKTLKIGNAQTIETVKKNHLDYRISHRFGNIYDNTQPDALNTSAQSSFGFDNASDIRNSLEYGILDNLSMGIGHSRLNGLVDGSVKWRFLNQTNTFSIPVSVAFFGATGYTHKTTKNLYSGVIKDFKTKESHRLNYFSQLIIASKIKPWLSLEVLPSYMYRNFIKENINTNNNSADVNGFFSLGFGARIKLNKRLCFIGDYYYNFASYYQNNPSVFNPLSLGFEIETGGHVFSLFFTNANGLIENNYISQTTDSWQNGQIKFGFSISRTFAL